MKILVDREMTLETRLHLHLYRLEIRRLSEGFGFRGGVLLEVHLEPLELQPALEDSQTAGCPVDNDVRLISRAGSAGVERPENATGPPEHGLRGVLDLDVVQYRADPGDDALGHPEEVAEQVQVVRRLVHQEPASFDGGAGPPGGRFVVGGRPRPVMRHADALDLSQFPGLDQALRRTHFGAEALLEADGEQPPCFSGGLDHGVGVVQPDSHRLLDQHVRTSLQTVYGDAGVKRLRREDHTEVWEPVHEHVPMICVKTTPQLYCPTPPGLLVDVRDGHEVHVRRQQRGHVSLQDPGTRADHRVPQTPGGPVIHALKAPLYSENVLQIALSDQLQSVVSRHGPHLFVEYLHFYRSGIAGSVHGLPHPSKLDHPITYHAARRQRIPSPPEPVVDVEPEDVSRRSLYLPIQLRVPPDVVDVYDHTYLRGVQSLHDVVCLSQRRDHGPVGGEGRVQGLYTEPDLSLLGIWQHLLDPLFDHPAGGVYVAVRGCPAHEHQHVGTHNDGLVYGAAVVVDACRPFGFSGGGKHSTTAETRDLQPGVAYHARALFQAGLGHLVAPEADPGYPGPCATRRGLAHTPGFGGHLVQAQACEIPVHETPATARTRRILSAASSGSESSLARSASTKSSERWTTERAVSSPPTIRKCVWWPFRYARKTMPV